MKLRSAGFAIGLFFLLILGNTAARAAVPLTKVVVTTGSFSEREAAIYVAEDQGFFRKYGVDLSFIQVRSGPVGMAALSAGESQLHWGSVTPANLGAIAEGADIVFVAGFINKLTGAFVVNPKIKSPAELKDKSLGVNSLSGGGWIFTMLTLDHWGLDSKRDRITIRILGADGVRAEAMSSGVIDGCQIGYTFASLLQNKGFRILADLEKLAIPYQGSGIISRRSSSPRPRRPWKTCSEDCSIALLSSESLRISPRSSKAWPKDFALGVSKTPRKVIKASSEFTRGKSIRTSTAFATSSACWALTTKKSAASKPRIWWMTAL